MGISKQPRVKSGTLFRNRHRQKRVIPVSTHYRCLRYTGSGVSDFINDRPRVSCPNNWRQDLVMKVQYIIQDSLSTFVSLLSEVTDKPTSDLRKTEVTVNRPYHKYFYIHVTHLFTYGLNILRVL